VFPPRLWNDLLSHEVTLAKGMCRHQEVIFIERNPISSRVTQTEPGRVWVCALKTDQRHKINGGKCNFKDNETECPDYEAFPEE